MSDDEFDPNDMYGESATVETVGSATKGFFETNRSIIVAAAVLLVTSTAAVGLTINGCGQEKGIADRKPTNSSNAVDNEIQNRTIGTDAKAIVDSTVGAFSPRAKEDELKAKEQAAIGAAAMTEFKSKVDSLRAQSVELTTMQSAFTLKLEGLKTNEQGARISASPDLIAQYEGVSSDLAKATRYDLGVETYLVEIDKFLAAANSGSNGNYVPRTQSFDQIERLDLSVAKRINAISNLSAVLEFTLKDAAKNPPGLPLASAIANLKTERADSVAKQLAEVSRTAREDSLAEAKKKLVIAAQDLIDSETAVKLAESNAQTLENNQKAKDMEAATAAGVLAAKTEAEKQRLKAEFDLVRGDVNTYLSPFISEGREFRGNNAGKGPVSYAAIVASGGLHDSGRGLAQLGVMGTRSRRPLGGFPDGVAIQWLGSPDAKGTEMFLEKAQELLRKYGKLMVEEGILAE